MATRMGQGPGLKLHVSRAKLERARCLVALRGELALDRVCDVATKGRVVVPVYNAESTRTPILCCLRNVFLPSIAALEHWPLQKGDPGVTIALWECDWRFLIPRLVWVSVVRLSSRHVGKLQSGVDIPAFTTCSTSCLYESVRLCTVRKPVLWTA